MMDIPVGSTKQDLVYKSTPQRDLKLTFLPPITEKYEKAPVYFLIPGGGWSIEDRQAMIDFSNQSVEVLRNEGFAVVSIDYRVCGEGVVLREIITDCFDAARYISHFADTLRIDRNRFVLSGHSAGAHLALMISYASQKEFEEDFKYDDKFNVKAVAALCPPTILHDNSTYGLDLSYVYNGCDTMEEREKTSPITYVAVDCPPTLLCAGTSDYLVFATSSEKLYEQLKDHNVPCKLKLSVGGGHCFEKVHSSIEPSIGMSEMQDILVSFVLQHM